MWSTAAVAQSPNLSNEMHKHPIAHVDIIAHCSMQMKQKLQYVVDKMEVMVFLSMNLKDNYGAEKWRISFFFSSWHCIDVLLVPVCVSRTRWSLTRREWGSRHDTTVASRRTRWWSSPSWRATKTSPANPRPSHGGRRTRHRATPGPSASGWRRTSWSTG